MVNPEIKRRVLSRCKGTIKVSGVSLCTKSWIPIEAINQARLCVTCELEIRYCPRLVLAGEDGLVGGDVLNEAGT